jgi:outer membrane protein
MWLGIRRAALAALALSLLATGALAQQQPPAAAPRPAPADGSAPMLALVVDVRHVVSESKAGKGIREQFEAQRQAFTKEVSTAEGSLRTQQQEIERQRSILSPEAFATKAREFEKKVADMRHGWEQKRGTLQYSLDVAYDHIERTMIEVVSQIALERHATLVLQKQQVVLVDKGFDITQETIARLDQKLPTVAFTLVKPPQGGPEAAKPVASGEKPSAAPKGKQGSSQKGEAQKKQ